MEKIKVNMSPNQLDVQTIHASQNDGEARQWEFELHNNGELIDTSDVKEQLVFKAYKGGTEQLLPENTSTPTTSPFLGDIRYPQGLLTDQEFTYRQSPTESDELAKIKSIKGNTLVWNQLVDTNTTSVTLTSGHKFITKVGGTYSLVNGTGQSISVTGGTDEVFDLSLMFGAGNEPTTVEDFTSLFPLSYYSYNQGSLLSFMGNGIKTVGFNQWDEEWEVGSINSQGQNTEGTSTIRSKNYISVFPNTSYFVRTGDDNVGAFIYFYDADKNFLSSRAGVNIVITTPNECRYIRFRMYDPNYGTVYKGNICINISDPSKNGTYEPYISSTLSLPISTYFPTGMKRAGNVYDELTESKAITRIGAVDLGTLAWEEQSTATAGKNRFRAVMPTNAKIQTSDTTNNKSTCSKYALIEPGKTYQNIDGYTISVVSGSALYVYVYDSSMVSLNASDFKTAMIGVYLYYELATPTETSFTTASLVTENAEIPLSNEDGVLIGKCTEQLSENPGFIDAKIKLSDSDGECYSNKIQLHVERSPQ